MGIAEITRKYPRKSLAFIVILHIVLHLPFINLPPCSIHVWRQCNTLAVARNFYTESGNILEPRVDRRGQGDGITGMHFPAYEWALSKIYFITGETYYAHRLFSLLLSSLSIVAIFFFLREVARDSFFALAGAWCLTWSPEFFYHSINALPDIAAFAAATGTCYTFLRWTYRGGRRLFIATFLLLTLAGLIKIQYFMITAFMAGSLLSMQKLSFQNLLKGKLLSLILLCSVSGSIILGWYLHARNMIAQSGLYDYGIEIRSAKSFNEGIAILKRNLISDFPELIINYGSLLLVVAAVLLVGKNRLRQRPAAFGFILLAFAYTGFHLLELHQMRVHQYYMLPALIIVVPIAAAGAVLLYRKNKWRPVVLIALIAAPVLASVRIIPARWWRDDLGIPKEFVDPVKLKALQNAVPANTLVAAGPDPSGCIFFYFLNKKGYEFRDQQIVELKSAYPGAEYVYIYKGGGSGTDAPYAEIGDFKIYQIRQEQGEERR
jgi:4-amino-4-deoxy-L-arabinose transferase-like glycosyltransferase